MERSGYECRKALVEKQLREKGFLDSNVAIGCLRSLEYNQPRPHPIARQLFTAGYRLEHINSNEWLPVVPTSSFRPQKYIYNSYDETILPQPFKDGDPDSYRRVARVAMRLGLVSDEDDTFVCLARVDWIAVATSLYTLSEEERAFSAYLE